MITKIPVFQALQLTAFEAGDEANLLNYLNDKKLYNNTLRVPNPYTTEDAASWLTLCAQEMETFGMPSNWAIRHAESGVIGGIGCMYVTGMDGHRDELGYWLAEPFRGKGWMSQIVANYLEFLFQNRPHLMRVEAHVFTHNLGSCRVLEKNGFDLEGCLKWYHQKDGTLLDAFLYARLRPIKATVGS